VLWGNTNSFLFKTEHFLPSSDLSSPMDKTSSCHNEDPTMGVWQRPLGQDGTNFPGVQFLVKNKLRHVANCQELFKFCAANTGSFCHFLFFFLSGSGRRILQEIDSLKTTHVRILDNSFRSSPSDHSPKDSRNARPVGNCSVS